MWVVQVLNNEKEVVKEIECSSERKAERVEDAMQINLDHENYYTIILNKDADE